MLIHLNWNAYHVNAQLAEKILYFIERILPGGENVKIYQELFARTSDIEFDDWMNRLANGEEILSIFNPNFHGTAMSLTNNIEVGEELELFTVPTSVPY